jgi:hypothetical protein
MLRGRSQSQKLRLRIRLRIHFRVRLGDASVLADHIGDALRKFVARRIRRTISDPDLAVGVTKQRKREVELLREMRIVRNVVETGAENRGVLLLVLVDEVPEPGTFFRSARGVSLRIEPEHDLAPAQIMQRDRVAIVIRDLEIRSLVANLEHSSSSQRLQRQPQFTRKGHGAIVVPLSVLPEKKATTETQRARRFLRDLCASVVIVFKIGV